MKRLMKFDLYSNGFIEEYPDGSRFLERNEIEYDGSQSDRIHIVKETDTLTRLAFFYYKNILANANHYWWIIADANDIDNPMDLSTLVGSEIVIPDPILFDLKK